MNVDIMRILIDYSDCILQSGTLLDHLNSSMSIIMWIGTVAYQFAAIGSKIEM